MLRVQTCELTASYRNCGFESTGLMREVRGNRKGVLVCTWTPFGLRFWAAGKAAQSTGKSALRCSGQACATWI